jgi:hypothetical protein
MKSLKIGKRHPLLLYRRLMDRIWTTCLLIGLLLSSIWGANRFFSLSLITEQNGIWLWVALAVLTGIAVFAILGRYAAYVQARQDHLRLITPFLQLRISYRRIRSIHPAEFQQLFPPDKTGWSQRRFLEPFLGKTAVVIDLHGYPMAPAILKVFLAPQMLSSHSPGFVLLVPDWMAFTTELDSMRAAWLAAQSPRSERGRFR